MCIVALMFMFASMFMFVFRSTCVLICVSIFLLFMSICTSITIFKCIHSLSCSYIYTHVHLYADTSIYTFIDRYIL